MVITTARAPPVCAGTPRGTITSTITTTGTVTTTTESATAPVTGTLIGMGDALSTPRKSHRHFADRPLWQRVAVIVIALIVVFGVPMAIATAVAGPDAAYASVMGAVATISGSFRSGWERTARVIPFIGALGVAAASVGYGWGWVAVMGVVGLVAGAGTPFGYMPALLCAGFVPTLVHEATDVRAAIVVGCFAMAGGAVGVVFARRLGAKRAPAQERRRKGTAVLGAVLGLLLMGGGSAIAVATGLEHGYWVPLTLIAVIPAIALGDSHRGRQRLAGTVAALLIVIPISFIPMPAWVSYMLGFLLFIPALVLYRRSYGFYAFLESAAVVLLVSAGHNVVHTGEARAVAAIIAIALVAGAVVVATWVLQRLPELPAPSGLVDN